MDFFFDLCHGYKLCESQSSSFAHTIFTFLQKKKGRRSTSSPRKIPSRIYVFSAPLTAKSPSRTPIIREEGDYFAYSRCDATSSDRFLRDPQTRELKSGDAKRSLFSRAYRTLSWRRQARSCRRSQDAEDAEERTGREDNEIEMAKADHRIGWLNGGWRQRRRRRRQRATKQVAQDEGANPRGLQHCLRASEVRAHTRARLLCSTKLILNRNISVE